ncbi:MAG: hypothetical protein HYX74_12005 [Acidobacteria bacterium]|nr:hypothetical protein [Acidobacteriota bacterium]
MHRLVVLAIVIAAFAPAAAEQQEWILPVAANGYTQQPIHFQTAIRLINLSSTSLEVTLEAYDNNGVPTRILDLFPLPLQGTISVLRLEPLGSIERFTAGDVPSLNGWIRLRYDGPAAALQASSEVALINAPVGPHPICSRSSTVLLASAEVPATRAANRFSGFAVMRPFRQSAYALLNPSTTATAEVFLSLLDFSGRFTATGQIQIPPQGRVSRYLAELLSNPPSDFMGALKITSSIPIGAGALNVLLPEGKLVGISLTPLPSTPCVQVIAPARNPLTGECRVFPTPCDVPDGWESVAACR